MKGHRESHERQRKARRTDDVNLLRVALQPLNVTLRGELQDENPDH